ncbi:MAG TPA: DUF4123 domain-containing protein [Pyrinomonadaceae bacterium]|nr:DUF4123 domain-containing protein [Pyrinomonadaceae bacterium]
MRLILEVISGPHKGQKIIAQAGQVVGIGRTSKAAVAMEDTFMSGQHFAIECVGGACGVRDLDSRNGTKLNDERITRAVVRDGDRIHAGQTDFLVHIELDDMEFDFSQFNKLQPTIPPDQSKEHFGINKPDDPAKQKSDRPVVNSNNEPARRDGKPASRGKPMEPTTHPFPEEPGVAAYHAATPQGSLLRILQNQPERLLALVDGMREKRVLDLVHRSGEEYRSLYRDEQNKALAPHLVRLPPQSALLKQMIDEGWGRGWGVYLTSNASLVEVREYFRSALMVKMPDGIEMFSRFYEPRFFRGFLENCTADEAQRYFGPIRAYLMEAERPEILLEFTRNNRGVDKKGHLLSVLDS